MAAFSAAFLRDAFTLVSGFSSLFFDAVFEEAPAADLAAGAEAPFFAVLGTTADAFASAGCFGVGRVAAGGAAPLP